MISGAAYVVKALQEENVEILFNYPGQQPSILWMNYTNKIR